MKAKLIKENLNEMQVNELAKNEFYALYKRFNRWLEKDEIRNILIDLLEELKDDEEIVEGDEEGAKMVYTQMRTDSGVKGFNR